MAVYTEKGGRGIKVEGNKSCHFFCSQATINRRRLCLLPSTLASLSLSLSTKLHVVNACNYYYNIKRKISSSLSSSSYYYSLLQSRFGIKGDQTSSNLFPPASQKLRPPCKKKWRRLLARRRKKIYIKLSNQEEGFRSLQFSSAFNFCESRTPRQKGIKT